MLRLTAAAAAGRGTYAQAPVWGLAVTETVSWGILYYAFPVLLAAMAADLGWSRAQLVSGFSLALVVSAAAAVPVGRWLDRHAPRTLMTTGSVTAVTLVLAWSQVRSPAAYLLVWAGIGIAMALVLYEPAIIVLTKHCRPDPRTALTTLTLVAGLASFLFQPLTAALADAYGWRGALMILAAILAVVTVPLHLITLPRRPNLTDDPTAEPAPQRAPAALRDRRLLLLTLAFVAASLTTSAAVVHLIPYLLERGWSPATAALASGTVGLMQLPGRISFAPASRRLSPTRLATGVLLAPGLALLIIVAAAGGPAVWPAIALLGAGNGTTTLLRAVLLGTVYGPARYGEVASTVSTFVTLARAGGPLATAVLLQLTGSYPLIFTAAASSALVAAVCVRPALQPSHRNR